MKKIVIKIVKKTIPKEYKRVVKKISDLRISQKYKTLKLLRYKIQEILNNIKLYSC